MKVATLNNSEGTTMVRGQLNTRRWFRVPTAPVVTEGRHDVAGDNDEMQDPMKCDDVMFKIVHQWKLSLHQIGINVVRIDQTLICYESEINQETLGYTFSLRLGGLILVNVKEGDEFK